MPLRPRRRARSIPNCRHIRSSVRRISSHVVAFAFDRGIVWRVAGPRTELAAKPRACRHPRVGVLSMAAGAGILNEHA